MSLSFLDAVVVGAGHAGLSISKLLSDQGLAHLVFEKGKTGESWRSQRWNSFKLNSSNKLNVLPGQKPDFSAPEAFPFAPAFVAQMEAYVREFNLPVVENATVISVEKDAAQSLFSVAVLVNGQAEKFYSRQVVVASGGQNIPVIPHFAKNIDARIMQLPAADYRNADQLPEGAVLVVGSAQSGMQIAEDLTAAGRVVFLSTGKVGRIPRTYRGRDIFDWMFDMGLYDVWRDEASPELLRTRSPQVSGVGVRGKTCSLQSLAKAGAVVLGKAEGADNDNVYLQKNAAEHVLFADAFSYKIKKAIDDHISKEGLRAPQPEEDPNDMPDEGASCASCSGTLSLKRSRISSIIWATGFTGDFSYLKLPLFNNGKTPEHRNGISKVDGLYFLGLPWLRKRKSAIIHGTAEDAVFVAQQVLQHNERRKQAVALADAGTDLV